jgi:hypothetical protein
MTARPSSPRPSLPVPLAVLILLACLLAANVAAASFRDSGGGSPHLAPGPPERPATAEPGVDGDGRPGGLAAGWRGKQSTK